MGESRSLYVADSNPGINSTWVSVAATYFIIQNKLELMIAFVNKGIRNKNEQHLKKSYQAMVAENQH